RSRSIAARSLRGGRPGDLPALPGRGGSEPPLQQLLRRPPAHGQHHAKLAHRPEAARAGGLTMSWFSMLTLGGWLAVVLAAIAMRGRPFATFVGIVMGIYSLAALAL